MYISELTLAATSTYRWHT